ncbi:hypothetical protein RJ639_044237 [Escallonia herrerae]|uniref:Pentatricopeptide repeat-containing protein n=1 Tax=Escallonia herrerae TaxID=1293975 RepID=A0AA88W9A1_9ASTE|nr:hypothetical protein RJ639_044237 [Escallonia herrerae]
MVNCFAQNGDSDEAIFLFREMQGRGGIEPSKYILLTALRILYIMDHDVPPPPEEPRTFVYGVPSDAEENERVKKERNKWKDDEFLCRRHILNGLSDRLYDLFTKIKYARDFWSALDYKYKAEEESKNKYFIAQYFDFVMVNDKPVLEQIHALQDYPKRLLHKFEDFTLEQFQKHLCIEEESPNVTIRSFSVQESDLMLEVNQRRTQVIRAERASPATGANANAPQDKTCKRTEEHDIYQVVPSAMQRKEQFKFSKNLLNERASNRDKVLTLIDKHTTPCSLQRMKKRVVLIQQGLLKVLKGKQGLPHTMSADEKEDMLERAPSALLLCLADNVLRKGSIVTGAAAITSSSDIDSDTTKLWYINLGHMSERGMDVLSKKGYASGLKGYMLCCPDSKSYRFLFSRDVTFDESLMLSKNKKLIGARKNHSVRHKVELKVRAPDSLPKIPTDEEGGSHSTEENKEPQEQQYSIASNRPRREIQPPQKYGYTDMVTYTLSVAESIEVEEPITYKRPSRARNQRSGQLLGMRRWNLFTRIKCEN